MNVNILNLEIGKSVFNKNESSQLLRALLRNLIKFRNLWFVRV